MSVLLSEEREKCLLLTLNRPESRNAISSELAIRLLKTLEEVEERKDLRCIIITGAGEQAFCAGTDSKERRELDPDQKWAQRTRGWRVNQAIWNYPKPVIAAIQGWCLGGGSLAVYALLLADETLLASLDVSSVFDQQ